MGGWPKPEGEYQQLYEGLVQRLGKSGLQVTAPNTWDKGAGKDKTVDLLGTYVAPLEWKLETGNPLQAGLQSGGTVKPKKGLDHVWLLRSSGWCLRLVQVAS